MSFNLLDNFGDRVARPKALLENPRSLTPHRSTSRGSQSREQKLLYCIVNNNEIKLVHDTESMNGGREDRRRAAAEIPAVLQIAT